MKRMMFTLAVLFCLTGFVYAQGMPVEGVHYVKLPNPAIVRLHLLKNVPENVDAYHLTIKYLGVNERGQADLEINYSERDHYNADYAPRRNNGFTPNLGNYPGLRSADLLSYAQTLYRTHRLCDGTLDKSSWKKGLEINDLSSGYKNFTGTNRFYEQCILDGSFDSYYDENLDYGTVPFNTGETKRSYEFSITLASASAKEASIEIVYIGRGRYVPTKKASEVLLKPGS